jgi:fructose-1,6-bisphosphatase I
MSAAGITLTRHILEQEQRHPEFAGQLSILLNQVAFAGKILAREISRAALIGKLGLVGDKNATGDSQKKLDIFGNETMIEGFAGTGMVSSIVSEELAEIENIAGAENADYVVCMDPLDGSSNTDINGSIGTIFGILPRRKGIPGADPQQFYRQGSEQVVAGYIMYSTSTVLVYSIGHGVYGFTLDRDLGEFLLSHENIRCPAHGSIYSANVSHYDEWDTNIRYFVDDLTRPKAAGRGPYSLRYTGALVADFHRCLLEGGLYFYPPDPGHKNGKLRLLYECSPLGFIAEQAGGAASSGQQRILDIQADSIHQRVPLAIGSVEDVALYDKFVREGRA